MIELQQQRLLTSSHRNSLRARRTQQWELSCCKHNVERPFSQRRRQKRCWWWMRNRQHRKKWSKNYGNLVNSTELLVMTFKAHTSHIVVAFFVLRLVSSTCFFHLFQLQNDDCVFSSHILFITSSSLHHICTKRAAFDRVFTFCGNDAWCCSFFVSRWCSHLLGVAAQRAVKPASAIISQIFHSLFYERCHSADCWLLWWPIQYQMGNYTTPLHIEKKVI